MTIQNYTNATFKLRPELSQIVEYRKCPACGSAKYRLLLDLSIEDYLRANSAYDRNWFHGLGVNSEDKFPLVRCKDCGFDYSLTQLKNGWLDLLYNEGFNHELSYKWECQNLRKKIIFNQIFSNILTLSEIVNPTQAPFYRVIDFGSGWGTFLRIIKENGHFGVGCEIDKRMIDYNIQNHLKVGDFNYVESYAPYDIAVCHHVLEHVSAPEDFIFKLSRLLKPGAIVFVSVPNFSKRRIKQEIKRYMSERRVSKELNTWQHLNYFTPSSLIRMLSVHGFTHLPLSTWTKAFKSTLLHLENSRIMFRGILHLVRAACSNTLRQTTSVYNIFLPEKASKIDFEICA
jgi:2-polyprenyl-3-methyl-5-hydroxy-6-metoxy-1,4-benzoquinol methylase